MEHFVRFQIFSGMFCIRFTVLGIGGEPTGLEAVVDGFRKSAKAKQK